MSPETLLFKTELGQSEISKQAILQSRPLRNVLLWVDGKRDVHSLQDMMRAISAPEDALAQLLELGLIAVPPAQIGVPELAQADDAFLHDDTEFPPELDLATGSAPEQPPAAADFLRLYQQINSLVSANLGMIKAYSLQLKIEQCQTPDQLIALLPEIKTALVAKHGEAKAIALLRQLGG